MARFLLLSLVLTFVNAHNWLMTPRSYNGNTPSTSLSCDNNNVANGLITVPFGGSVPMTWSTNHAGVHTIKVLQVTTDASTTSGASAATAAAQAASGATLTATGPLETGTVTTGNGNVIYSTTFQTATASGTITTGTTANAIIKAQGVYIVQYGWANYRNCFTLQVIVAGATGAPSPAPPTSAPLPPASCASYCNQTIIANKCPGNFASMDDCLAKCSTYPVGSRGDVAQNSLNCRMFYLSQVISTGGADVDNCGYSSYDGNLMCIGQNPTMFPSVSFQIQGSATQSAVLLASRVQAGILNAITGLTSADFFVAGATLSVGSDGTQIVSVSVQFYGSNALKNQAIVQSVPVQVTASLSQVGASVASISQPAGTSSSSSGMSSGGVAALVIFIILALGGVLFALYWFKFRTASAYSSKDQTSSAAPAKPTLAPKPLL